VNKTLTTLAAAVLAFSALAAAAQTAASAPGTNTPRIDQRQANQERRIDQGVASGELTQREARHLNRQQNRIDAAENKAKADGSVSAQERKRLAKAQNHSSRAIYRQKHDRQDRNDAPAKP
jgi:opacity protein-like surface antigen